MACACLQRSLQLIQVRKDLLVPESNYCGLLWLIFLWPCLLAWGFLVPRPEIEPTPLGSESMES